LTALSSFSAAFLRAADSFAASAAKRAPASFAVLSSAASCSAPASIRARSPAYFSASAFSASTGELYLRPAARSANSRSSIRSSSCGSWSATRSAGFGRELLQFLYRVTQPIGLPRRPLDLGAMLGDGVLGVAPRRPQCLDRSSVVLEPAIGVEQAAMGAGIDQGAGVVLPMDLDQRGAERLQRLDADRLVVDEGAGAAVGELHAAQDHRLIHGDVGQQRARRMFRRQFKHRGDLALLGALAHQGGVTAGAQRQREGVEQDRLAGPGLAGQHGKA
jgi:hypothetical protein